MAKKEIKKDCSMSIKVDAEGKLTESHISGNVGELLKAMAATTAYLIEAHKLDPDKTVEYFKKCIDVNVK